MSKASQIYESKQGFRLRLEGKENQHDAQC